MCKYVEVTSCLCFSNKSAADACIEASIDMKLLGTYLFSSLEV